MLKSTNQGDEAARMVEVLIVEEVELMPWSRRWRWS
jgi:hypothetical protein